VVRGHKPSEASKRSLHNLFERHLSEQAESEVDNPNLRYEGPFNSRRYVNKIMGEIGRDEGRDDCIVAPGWDWKYGPMD